MKKSVYAVILTFGIGVILTLSGCSTISSLNPFAKKAAPRNVPAQLVEFQPTKTVRTVWSTNIGSSKGLSFTPVYTYDGIYAASADGTLARIDAATGEVIWRISSGIKLTAGVGSDRGVVAVAGEKGALLAFDSDGKQLWKVQLSSEILSAPAVGSGLVVVRSLDNNIAAYDARTGERQWIVTRRAPALTLRAAPGITITGPIALVALPGGRLVSLVLKNGGIHWEASVGDPRGTTELERIADTSGFPAIYRNMVCAVAYQGRVGCYDIASGNAIWNKSLSSDVGVSVDERFVFAADEAGSVYALSSDRGQSVWRNERLAHRGLSGPISFGSTVAVGDNKGFVHFLSREDGSFVARVATDGTAVMSNLLIAGDKLIVQTSGGTLSAITIDY